jgi:hypothetical protein
MWRFVMVHPKPPTKKKAEKSETGLKIPGSIAADPHGEGDE